MSPKVHRIHSLPQDAPWDEKGAPADAQPRVIAMLDRVLALQRPVVLAHLTSVRLRHRSATTVEMITILERRYLTAVTTGGAAVGATAVVPGIGTGITLALSGVETVGFLEATTLFAQSVAEVHGFAVEDPERARAMVLTLLLGDEGVDLLRNLAGQATGAGVPRDRYWGEVVTKTLPRAALGPIVDRLSSMFVRQFAARGGASWLGKALPFGVGAAVGGAGNHILGRRVLRTSRRAFGPPPITYPAALEPTADMRRTETRIASGLQRAARSVAAAASSTGSAISRAGRSTKDMPSPDKGSSVS